MHKHREESNVNDLEQNNIMPSHREESNARRKQRKRPRAEQYDAKPQRRKQRKPEQVCTAKIRWKSRKFSPKRTVFFFFVNYKQAGE